MSVDSRGVMWVFAGGFVGSLLRIQLSVVMFAYLIDDFAGVFDTQPNSLTISMLANLSVNVLGAFLCGVLGALYQQQRVSERLWQFAGIGALGAFTTFSAFALDAMISLKLQLYTVLFLYVGGSMGLCVVAAGLGYYAMHEKAVHGKANKTKHNESLNN